MKAEDVPGKWAEMLLRAFGHTPHNFSQAQAALAAVAPIIAAAEREACAKYHDEAADGERDLASQCGARRWNLAGCKWSGAVMTGHATEPVSDAEMAAQFPGCGWC